MEEEESAGAGVPGGRGSPRREPKNSPKKTITSEKKTTIQKRGLSRMEDFSALAALPATP